MKSSVVLRNALLGSSGFAEIFPAGFLINLYSGPQPANPEDAASGTLLGTISLGGAPGVALTLDAPNAGAVNKPAAATWACNALVASGSLGYARMYRAADNPSAANSSHMRIDFSVGVTGSGADVIVSSTSYNAGDAFQLSSFAYSIV